MLYSLFEKCPLWCHIKCWVISHLYWWWFCCWPECLTGNGKATYVVLYRANFVTCRYFKTASCHTLPMTADVQFSRAQTFHYKWESYVKDTLKFLYTLSFKVGCSVFENTWIWAIVDLYSFLKFDSIFLWMSIMYATQCNFSREIVDCIRYYTWAKLFRVTPL